MNDNNTNSQEEIRISSENQTPEKTAEEKRSELIKKFSKANICIFSLLLAASSTLLFCGKRPTKSETENRMLAEFPEFSVERLVSGEFTNGLSDFYNDTVPMRTKLKHVAASIKSHTGVDLGGARVYSVSNSGQKKKPNANAGSKNTVTTTPAVTEAAVSETTADDRILIGQVGETEAPVTTVVTEAVTEEVTEAPEQNELNDDIGELSNDIMIYKKRGIMIYYEDEDNCAEYASILNTYKERLGAGVNVYNLVCPTAISFYWPPDSDIYHSDESHALGVIRDNLVNVIDINTIPILKEHSKEHIYSRTDHHWQARGAYYAGKVFAEAAKVPYPDLSTYKEEVIHDYVGTLYGFSEAAVLNDNPEDFVYYVPEENYTTDYYTTSYDYMYEGSYFIDGCEGVGAYCTFMMGDEHIVHIETQAPNDRTLFIIKDSYGNAIVPFLTNSFKNIYVCDLRYFDLNIIDFMKEHNATDLLFCMNTFSATGSNYNCLYDLLNQ